MKILDLETHVLATPLEEEFAFSMGWVGRRSAMHKLLGSAWRTEVQPYATGFYRLRWGHYPADAEQEARRHVARGFSAMKLKIGFGFGIDREVIARCAQRP